MKIDEIRFDCRYYTGFKPCGKSLECKDCSSYAPRGKRVLIIKLGAMGDVLRTTPLLRAIKQDNSPSFITWLTDEASRPLLADNHHIDRLLTFNLAHVLPILAEEFDVLYNFEKEPRALALASLIKSSEKRGFCLNSFGTMGIFNKESEYALILGIDDELKFSANTKTYQEIVFEIAGFQYNHEEYVLDLTERAIQFGKQFHDSFYLERFGYLVGIHPGSGSVFRTKLWSIQGWVELLINLVQDDRIGIILMGGAAERELNQSILQYLGAYRRSIIDSGTDNTIEQFCGIMNCCDLVVSLDSLAMHIAIGLRKKVVALFGPTAPQEIDLYSRGTIIMAPEECAPCYKSSCTRFPRCMDNISGEMVASTVKELLFGSVETESPEEK